MITNNKKKYAVIPSGFWRHCLSHGHSTVMLQQRIWYSRQVGRCAGVQCESVGKLGMFPIPGTKIVWNTTHVLFLEFVIYYIWRTIDHRKLKPKRRGGGLWLRDAVLVFEVLNMLESAFISWLESLKATHSMFLSLLPQKECNESGLSILPGNSEIFLLLHSIT